MRLLFITDSHTKAKNPERRSDVFALSILRKFLEISTIASHNKVDAVIHGGDMFDMPRVAPDFVGQLVEIIRTSETPWYVVPGNHDLYGHTVKTISQTMLGLIAKSGIVNILTRDNPTVLYDSLNRISVSLQGQEYYAQIDHGNPLDYDVVQDTSCGYHILIAHGMLLDRPFCNGVSHTLVSSLNSNADLILAGHYHPGFKPMTVGKTQVINPGSMARVSASKGDERTPQYVVIDINSNGIKTTFRDFKTAKPYQDVLNITGKTIAQSMQTKLNGFKSLLQIKINLPKATDIVTVLNTIAADPTNNVDQQLVQDCLTTIGNVQISKDNAVPKLDGYIVEGNRVFITNIKANNFMCYKDLDITLDPNLNVIRGESNSGKTTLLRLIKWVQYGEPRGSEMISHWAKDVIGSITYSNGYRIERSRSKKDSGKVEIFDIQGNLVSSYKGVKDNPVDILNICQMPQIFITKDDKRNIAFADQLETSFLVTESSGFRASAIGRLTGLQNIDASIRVLNTENKALSKEINIKDDLLQKDIIKSQKYNDLPNIQKRIDNINNAIIAAQSIEKDIEELKDVATNLIMVDNNIQKINTFIRSYNLPTDDLFNQVEELTKYIEDLETLQIESYMLSTKETEVKDAYLKLAIMPKLDKEFEELDKLCSRIDLLTEISSNLLTIDNDIDMIVRDLNRYKNIPDLNKAFDNLDVIANQYNILLNLRDERYAIDKQQLYYQELIEDSQRQLEDLDHKMEQMFSDSSCLCPTCNQLISKDIIMGGI